MFSCAGVPGEAVKLLCRARHTRRCHWDSHATGCSRKSREHPPPDSSRAGPCGFCPQDQILLSHLRMGFWRSRSPTARSRSWEETREKLGIHATVLPSLLAGGLLSYTNHKWLLVCSIKPSSTAQQLLCQTLYRHLSREARTHLYISQALL